MATQATSERIILDFGWKGPSTWRGGCGHGGFDVRVVDLIFKDAKKDFSVSIPDNIHPSTVQNFPFTCRKYQETEWELTSRKFKPLAEETHPDSLRVTVEQIHNLTIKAGFFEENPHKGPAIMDSSGKITYEKRILRSDSEVKLEVPKKLEIGQAYTLVVTSDDSLSLSAHLLKKEGTDETMKDKRSNDRNEFQRRINNMGTALIHEGIQNLRLVAEGKTDVDSPSTEGGVFARAMQGIIRAGQQMHPDIRVPPTRASESISDLGELTTRELQSRLTEAFKKDKEFESQRLQAAFAGNVQEINKILEKEAENSQLLLDLGYALKRKGVEFQIPTSEDFRSAAN